MNSLKFCGRLKIDSCGKIKDYSSKIYIYNNSNIIRNKKTISKKRLIKCVTLLYKFN